MNYLSETEINNYMQHNCKYFECSEISLFKNLIAGSNLTLEELNTFKFKSPALGLLLSVLLGSIGIDRFYSENYLLGALKLFTFGGCGLWTMIDWFLIGNAIKRNNQTRFFNFLNGTTASSVNINADKVTNVLKSDEMRQGVGQLAKSTKDILDSFTDIG